MGTGTDYGHYDSLSHSRDRIRLCQFTCRFTDSNFPPIMSKKNIYIYCDMLHVLVYCDLTTLNARKLPAEALGTEVLCVEGWLACMHACRGMGGD